MIAGKVLTGQQCEAEWPSPVTGGMTDAQCVEEATVVLGVLRLCAGCAKEVLL